MSGEQQHFYMEEFLLLLFQVFILPSFYCCSASWRDLAAAIKVQNSIQLDQARLREREGEGTEREKEEKEQREGNGDGTERERGKEQVKSCLKL